jgi:hypothetical protein
MILTARPVQEIHPVFLQDPQNNVLQYSNDEDQDLLRNNGNFLQKNSSNQGQIYGLNCEGLEG